jgi:hypothetical protein
MAFQLLLSVHCCNVKNKERVLMKKSHGLYILTSGLIIFVLYFIGAAIYATGGLYNTMSRFLEIAWPMPVVAIALGIGGIYVFIHAKD